MAYRPGWRTFLVPLAGAGVATWLAYRGVAAEVRIFSVKWSAAPPTSLDYVPGCLPRTSAAASRLFVPAGLLLAGVWSATQERKTLLPLCVLVGIVAGVRFAEGRVAFPVGIRALPDLLRAADADPHGRGHRLADGAGGGTRLAMAW